MSDMLLVWRIVLIVVFVIVAIVILVLFFPVTYRVDVDLDNRNGRFIAGWLFRLIRFRLQFDEETTVALGVFFFSLDFLDEERRNRRRARREERNRKRREEHSGAERFLHRVRSVTHVFSLVRDHQVIRESMPLLRKFLYRARPRDVHGTVAFGLRDPARTGEIVGAVAALPVIYRTDLAVVPDFETEETYIEGDIHARGHILMFHALLLFIGLIRKKNIRAFIGALRN